MKYFFVSLQTNNTAIIFLIHFEFTTALIIVVRYTLDMIETTMLRLLRNVKTSIVHSKKYILY